MTGTDLGEQQRFHLRNGQEPLTFIGWQLAEADSQRGTDERWTELGLYRTATGRYVVETVGRSDVYHTRACSKGKRFETLSDAVGPDDRDSDGNITGELDDLFIPCGRCEPTPSTAPVWVEQDLSSVTVHENATAAVTALRRQDHNGTWFLSRVARSLLDTAAVADPEIGKVLHTPIDVT